jgi:hypothetical protein
MKPVLEVTMTQLIAVGFALPSYVASPITGRLRAA